MNTKQEILERLSAVPTQNILHLLRDETIFDLASKFLQPINGPSEIKTHSTNGDIMKLKNTISAKTGNRVAAKVTSDRAKRPLNAFMAFRSYYLKLFPEVQQKAASGFLTTLWNKDPFRNKWSLIAKVYSSIRDEVGKGNVSLTNFLETICPIMEIPAPSIYLPILGWTVGETGNGLKQLLKDGSEPPIIESSPSCPKTELELLQALITIGYMQEEGDMLSNIIKASNGGLMTTSLPPRKLAKSQTSPTPTPQEATTQQPITTNPSTAEFPEAYTYSFYTEKNLPLHNLQPLQTATGYFSLPDLYRVSATPEPAISSSIPNYDYSTTQQQQQAQTQTAADSSPVTSTAPSSTQQSQSHIQQQDDAAILRFETILDHEAFDIDSPWDVDVVLGYTSVPLSNSDFDPREDFHYAF